jgi:hypothetical protein
VKHRAKLSIDLPQITEFGKKRAKDIANAHFVFEIDGKPERFFVHEIKPELLRAEAERLAAIPDAQSRAKQMFECMASCLEMTADCQRLASEFVRIADELQTAGKQLDAARNLLIDQMDKRRDDKKGT